MLPSLNTTSSPLIKPKEFRITDEDGLERVYMFSRFDSITAREIYAKWMVNALPTVGIYEINEEMMFKIFAHVAVNTGTEQVPVWQRLTSRALIINHVPYFELLGFIEVEMLKYNSSFFRKEKVLTFFEQLLMKCQQKIIEMLTPSSLQSSTPKPQPITNSEQSTT